MARPKPERSVKTKQKPFTRKGSNQDAARPDQRIGGAYKQHPDDDDALQIVMPFEMPCYMTLHRLLAEEDNGLEGWVIELNFYTLQRKVYLRLPRTHGPREGVMKIFVEGKEMTKVWEGWRGDAGDPRYDQEDDGYVFD